MLGHLRLKEVVEAAVHQASEDVVASENVMDLIVVDVDFNRGHRWMLGLVIQA